MGVTAEQVRVLREKTGAGLMDCKRALVEADGDEERAMLVLREKGLAKAEKKRGRSASEGLVIDYIHDGKIGVMVELNCETDFVARNQEFQKLGREVCMQIAAMRPLAVTREELPDELIETEKVVYAQQAEGKPEHIIEKMVAGKLEKFYQDVCLLDQAYIRDPDRSVKEVIDDAIALIGEKIEVRRFICMEVGENLD